MRSFIHRKSLENFRRQLTETHDEEKRPVLEKPLSEEEANKGLATGRHDDDRCRA